MASDDIVHVDQLESFHLLTPVSEPDLIMLSIKTRDGSRFNFAMPRKQFLPVLKVWLFDLEAADAAIEAGSPLPGKAFGSPDKKAS